MVVFKLASDDCYSQRCARGVVLYFVPGLLHCTSGPIISWLTESFFIIGLTGVASVRMTAFLIGPFSSALKMCPSSRSLFSSGWFLLYQICSSIACLLA